MQHPTVQNDYPMGWSHPSVQRRDPLGEFAEASENQRRPHSSDRGRTPAADHRNLALFL